MVEKDKLIAEERQNKIQFQRHLLAAKMAKNLRKNANRAKRKGVVIVHVFDDDVSSNCLLCHACCSVKTFVTL